MCSEARITRSLQLCRDLEREPSRQSAQTLRENVIVLLEQKGPCHHVDTSFPV